MLAWLSDDRFCQGPLGAQSALVRTLLRWTALRILTFLYICSCTLQSQRSLISYFLEIGPEIVGFGGLNGTLLPDKIGKGGGEAPHLFHVASL